MFEVEHLRKIITRCGRDNVLKQEGDRWEIHTRSGDLVDSDTNFQQLFDRAYLWEEDVPGYEGLLWRCPARMSGDVCLKGTRIPATTIAACMLDGDNPKLDWPYITDQQISAAVDYMRKHEPLSEYIQQVTNGSSDGYWADITTEIEASIKDVRHAHLLNHQAAHLLFFANLGRRAAKAEMAKNPIVMKEYPPNPPLGAFDPALLKE